MLSSRGVLPNRCKEFLTTAKSLKRKISLNELSFNKNAVLQHAILLSQEK